MFSLNSTVSIKKTVFSPESRVLLVSEIENAATQRGLVLVPGTFVGLEERLLDLNGEIFGIMGSVRQL